MGKRIEGPRSSLYSANPPAITRRRTFPAGPPPEGPVPQKELAYRPFAPEHCLISSSLCAWISLALRFVKRSTSTLSFIPFTVIPPAGLSLHQEGAKTGEIRNDGFLLRRVC